MSEARSAEKAESMSESNLGFKGSRDGDREGLTVRRQEGADEMVGFKSILNGEAATLLFRFGVCSCSSSVCDSFGRNSFLKKFNFACRLSVRNPLFLKLLPFPSWWWDLILWQSSLAAFLIASLFTCDKGVASSEL